MFSKVVDQKVKRGYSGVRCPKCNGNIFFDGSNENLAVQQDNTTGWCLQCGYVMYPERDRIVAEELTPVSLDSNKS